MNPSALPTTRGGKAWHLAEECGEVMQALSKAERFGWNSRHPKDGNCTKRQVVLAEIGDLIGAAERLRDHLLRMTP